MNTNTKESTSRTLKIDGMSGDDCVQKVKGVLQGVTGVKTESVRVGAATIGADKAGCSAACHAIDQAGFPAREQTGSESQHKAGTHSQNQSQFGNESRNQTGNESRDQDADESGKHSGARPATSQGRDRQPQKGDRAPSTRA